jgi:hypothetical protein
MEKRGRPAGSPIRQNIVEILHRQGSGYGYDLYKAYIAIFPRATMRSIYYNLEKGVSLDVFKVDRIEKVQGDYSWGESAEKIYYSLGKNAHPSGDERVMKYFEGKNGPQGTG